MTTALDASGPPVDLLRLVVLVRVRRVLRVGARVALLALPAWFVVVLAAVIATDDGSATHVWFEDHATRGFVVVAVVLAVALVLAAGAGRVGPAGSAATRLMPMVWPVPDPVLGPPAGPNAGRLLDVGSRDRRVPAPGTSRSTTALLALALVVLIPFGARTAAEVHPQYLASHGRGGPIVTVTADPGNIRVDNRDADGATYYIASPRGEVVTDARRRPEPGTRYALVETSDGVRAIRLGGSTWIETLVAVGIMFVVACGLLLFLVRRLAARVPDGRIVPLALTLDELQHRDVTVQAVGRRGTPAPPPTVLVAGQDTGEDGLGRVRSEVRRVTAGLIALLLTAGLVTALV